ncbi:hypothetical protein ACFSSA_09540 [Luteolibacter algae]|uniref:Uncharacterized protein n=1 Tax=Luteolibacter algae TaxID=454151 RepID=A0ABW5D751_9BACT
MDGEKIRSAGIATLGVGRSEYRGLVATAEGDELGRIYSIFSNTMAEEKKSRLLQVICGILLIVAILFIVTREPKRPAYQRWKDQAELLEKASEKSAAKARRSSDTELVRGLLNENLSDREFDFSVIAEAASGRKVIPLKSRESGDRVIAAISKVMDGLLPEMSASGSPVHELGRINEGSKYFENSLLKRLGEIDGISCEIPETRGGSLQRAGYPDLKITDKSSGEVYYLDPKLLESGSADSTFRSFYFAPKNETLKITEDATHLLLGIEHDGNDGRWRFLKWRLVDLSDLKVRLKAEFHASNRDIYTPSSVLEMNVIERKDDDR